MLGQNLWLWPQGGLASELLVARLFWEETNDNGFRISCVQSFCNWIYLNWILCNKCSFKSSDISSVKYFNVKKFLRSCPKSRLCTFDIWAVYHFHQYLYRPTLRGEILAWCMVNKKNLKKTPQTVAFKLSSKWWHNLIFFWFQIFSSTKRGRS